MELKTRSDVILYVWDYFYVSHVPAQGDEKVWAAIERATCRIRESEFDLQARFPADIRMRSARRIRNAARVALRAIERHSVQPERWVIDRLGALEAEMQALLESLCDPVRAVVVH